MSIVLNALIPVILIVVIGFAIQRILSVETAFWNRLESFTYYLFAPALLISSLANKPLADVAWSHIVISLLSVLFLCSALLLVWQRYIRPTDMATFTSLFQGGVRFNSFVALALANNLLGNEGLLIGAIATVTVIITVNIFCVAVFSFSNAFSSGWKQLPRQLATNPLVLGCLIGLLLNLSGLGLPSSLDNLLSMLGKAALPMALLAIGAALKLSSSRGALEFILVSSFFQYLFKPISVLTIGYFLQLDAVTLTVLVIVMAVPTAPSAYILAKKLGGNDQVMASIITAQTLLAFITLPATLSLMVTWFPQVLAS